MSIFRRKKPKTDWSKSPYPRTCELLESYGLNPAEIAPDGLSYNGYESFVTDENGDRQVRPDSAPGEWHRNARQWSHWSLSHDRVVKIMETYLQEKNALRWGARVEANSSEWAYTTPNRIIYRKGL